MRLRPLVGLVLATIALAEPAHSQGEIDQAAQAAIERSRTTNATYSVYNWNRITIPGAEPIEEWSAEFHDGTLYRVETPRNRLIADCAAGIGTHVNLASGERTRNQAVARAACGVQANSRVLSASFDGRTTGEYGNVDHVTIRDPENVRTYEIATNGAIVGATIQAGDGTVRLRSRAIALKDTVAVDIFSEESLATSAVPDALRRPPID